MMKFAVVLTSRVCLQPCERTSAQKSWVRNPARTTSVAPSSAIEYTFERPAPAAMEYAEYQRVSRPIPGAFPGTPDAVLYICHQYCITPFDGPVVPEVKW